MVFAYLSSTKLQQQQHETLVMSNVGARVPYQKVVYYTLMLAAPVLSGFEALGPRINLKIETDFKKRSSLSRDQFGSESWLVRGCQTFFLILMNR